MGGNHNPLISTGGSGKASVEPQSARETAFTGNSRYRQISCLPPNEPQLSDAGGTNRHGSGRYGNENREPTTKTLQDTDSGANDEKRGE